MIAEIKNLSPAISYVVVFNGIDTINLYGKTSLYKFLSFMNFELIGIDRNLNSQLEDLHSFHHFGMEPQ